MPHIDRKREQCEGVGRALVADLRRGDLKRSLGRDLRELYAFYLDPPKRERLAGMGRLRRWLWMTWWLLKSLLLRLPPARRVLLGVALLLFLLGDFHYRSDGTAVDLNFSGASFLVVLVVLMLELKDKLLARDELEAGRAVQFALLPSRAPAIDSWEVWLHTQPANDVGGDLVDYLWLEDGRLGLALGDVAGKGLGAALLMAKLQSTLRALADGAGALDELAGRVNRILCRDGITGRFTSLLYLEACAGDGRLRLVNAGHLPPLVLSGGAIRRLKPVAMALGLQADAAFVEQSLELGPGDLLVLYSDGISEAADDTGGFYGEDRLDRLVSSLGGLPAAEAGQRILAAVERFVEPAPPSDDLSLIVLRRVS